MGDRAVQDQSANGCAFRVGDIVECVNVRPRYSSEIGVPDGIELGGLYTVTRIYLDFEDLDGPTLTVELREVRNVSLEYGDEEGFLASRFRLIHRPDAKLIESLKALPAKPDLVSA